jgi:hypothetical protein
MKGGAVSIWKLLRLMMGLPQCRRERERERMQPHRKRAAGVLNLLDTTNTIRWMRSENFSRNRLTTPALIEARPGNQKTRGVEAREREMRGGPAADVARGGRTNGHVGAEIQRIITPGIVNGWNGQCLELQFPVGGILPSRVRGARKM